MMMVVVAVIKYQGSLSQLSLGSRHPLVSVTRTLERMFGGRAAAAFCVTRAMQVRSIPQSGPRC